MNTSDSLDRDYNARAGIPEAGAIIAAWQSRAAASRASMAGLQDLQYGTAEEEKLDLFWCLKPDRPLFVFIHGGYWRALDKSDFSWLAEPFVKAGINVAVINYTLLPKIRLEALVRQVLASLVWLHDHAEALDFDPHEIYVGGHSAGGHLSAMMLTALWPKLRADLPSDMIKGAICVSGLFDLEPLAKAPFLSADLDLSPEQARALSPVYMPPAHHAQLLLSVGGNESSAFHQQSQDLRDAWSGKIEFQEAAAPGLNHLTVCSALGDGSHALFKAALEMMDK